MSQIMRLRRRAGSDHHIKDRNNGFNHEHAFVKNIRKNGAVRVQVGTRSTPARARIARAGKEDSRARELLDEKYMGWKPGKKLSSWARGATPVAIDLPD